MREVFIVGRQGDAAVGFYPTSAQTLPPGLVFLEAWRPFGGIDQFFGRRIKIGAISKAGNLFYRGNPGYLNPFTDAIGQTLGFFRKNLKIFYKPKHFSPQGEKTTRNVVMVRQKRPHGGCLRPLRNQATKN